MSSTYFHSIQQLISERKYTEALEKLQNQTHTENVLAEVNYYMAICLLHLTDLGDALKHISNAIELSPDNANYLSERGVIYYHLDKKSLALIDMNAALELEPENPYRHSSRAYIKDSLGDTEGAIMDYEKAIMLDPDDAVALNNLGLLQEKLGYQEKANINFKKADELSKEWESLLKNEEPHKTEIPQTPAPLTEKPKPTAGDHLRVMKDVFFKKDTFIEFTRFWKDKFKRKNKDQ